MAAVKENLGVLSLQFFCLLNYLFIYLVVGLGPSLDMLNYIPSLSPSYKMMHYSTLTFYNT